MKNRFIKFTSAIVLSAMLLTACASAPKGAMVKIGDKYITEEQVQKEYDRVISSYTDEQKEKYDESTEEGKTASLTLKQNILEMFSNIEVVKQKFAKLEKEYKDEGKSEEDIAKVTVTEEEVNESLSKVKEQLGDKFNEELEKAKLTEDELKYKIEDNLYSSKFQTWFAENYTPTDEEVAEKYKGSDFDGPQINASHILVETEEDAKKVKSRLDAGEKFEDVATEVSKDPSVKNNKGVLGTFTKGIMVQEFYDAAVKLKVGEISEPVKTKFGYHIIKLNEIVEDYSQFTDESKKLISQKLKQKILSEKFKTEFESIQKEVGYLPIKNFK
ncbi:peptidylprolyl isomerase [Parvimonas micra]|uniref:peptidylprolyl isomerase n=1 Tax=Parvimonas TaxID=543311 RepID=UPI00020DCA9C|nr:MULTISPECIES: peptidylprolyl isomerase [unclassified Parvimonas]EGL38660.1 PPIC-type PPIASE domain protein [Parvimonas sp. oral taxon 110 str. F0139]MEB3012653.1 peptidylprolyl isomerase [Parvimonas sp. D2]MEB3086832.1 peptidylprolyl isomerase [Parvimonas sp. D4]